MRNLPWSFPYHIYVRLMNIASCLLLLILDSQKLLHIMLICRIHAVFCAFCFYCLPSHCWGFIPYSICPPQFDGGKARSQYEFLILCMYDSPDYMACLCIFYFIRNDEINKFKSNRYTLWNCLIYLSIMHNLPQEIYFVV